MEEAATHGAIADIVHHAAIARTTPYTRGSPLPPTISVPNPAIPLRANGTPADIELDTSPSDIDTSLVTPQELEVIAQISPQLTASIDTNWKYESRRQAQRIVDWLYLGANVAIRDLRALQRKGITMIIVARDSRMMTWNQKSCDLAEQELGIKTLYIDVNSTHQLISGFPQAIRAINEHLLAVHQSRTDNTTHGKVLVTCETGNDRSAAIVAAYLIAVLGCPLARALHFVTIQRFCAAFDDNLKRMLNNWEDLVRARATVARGQPRDPSPYPKTKRGFEDTMDVDSASEHEGALPDGDRFEGRNGFVPFRDMVDDYLEP